MRYVGAILLTLLLAFTGYLYLDRERVQQAIVAEVAAHNTTKANYKAAVAEAGRLEAERALAQAKTQTLNNERLTDDFEKGVADARTRYQRLYESAQNAGAAGGSTGGLQAAGPDSAAQLAEACAKAGLPPKDALIATEQAYQLKGLLDWIEVNGLSKPEDEPIPGPQQSGPPAGPGSSEPAPSAGDHPPVVR